MAPEPGGHDGVRNGSRPVNASSRAASINSASLSRASTARLRRTRTAPLPADLAERRDGGEADLGVLLQGELGQIGDGARVAEGAAGPRRLEAQFRLRAPQLGENDVEPATVETASHRAQRARLQSLVGRLVGVADQRRAPRRRCRTRRPLRAPAGAAGTGRRDRRRARARPGGGRRRPSGRARPGGALGEAPQAGRRLGADVLRGIGVQQLTEPGQQVVRLVFPERGNGELADDRRRVGRAPRAAPGRR